MQFVRHGDFLTAARITGPTHNLVSIRLGAPIDELTSCECFPAAGGCRHGSLSKPEIIRHVLKGAAEANEHLGTSYAVLGIRYVENDTPPESAYWLMARAIIEHLHGGGQFAPAGA